MHWISSFPVCVCVCVFSAPTCVIFLSDIVLPMCCSFTHPHVLLYLALQGIMFSVLWRLGQDYMAKEEKRKADEAAAAESGAPAAAAAAAKKK